MTMKTYTQKELNRILDKHKLWLYSQGKEGIKVNFRGAFLTEVDLRGAGLQGVDLQGVEFDDIIMIIDTTKCLKTIFDL